MRTSRIRFATLAVAVTMAATTFVAAPSGASPSWTPIAATIVPPAPAFVSGHAAQADAHATPTSCYQGLCEYLAAMVVSGFSEAKGASVMLNQPRPKVASGERSVTALGIESADGRQAVSFGWMVSKKLFHDTLPHVVVSSVVNGVAHCINACGFVPVVRTEPKVSVGQVGKYTIKLSKSRWLIVYNTKTIGYFPTSLWPGNKLSRARSAAAFGEVVSPSKTTPRSDMGNGKPGTDKRSAKIVGMTLLNGKGAPTYSYIAIDAPKKYNIGFTNPACHTGCSMHYGGPGF